MSLISRNLRRTAMAAVGVGVLLSAAACGSSGSGGGSTNNSSGPVTMTLWTNSTTGPGVQYFKTMVADYHKANPNVTIKVDSVQNEDLDAKLQTALQGGQGTAPDIFLQRGGGKLGQMVQAGQVADITNLISSKTKSAIPSGDFADDSWQGKIYAMPLDIQPGGFFYSKDLFKQAGITSTPTTLADLESDVSKLKAANITPIAVGAKDGWPAAHWYYWFAMRECSQSTLNSTAQSVNFSDACWTKAGNDLQKFAATNPFEPGFLNVPAQTGAGSSAGLVANHKAAMELSGGWDPGVIASLTPNKKPLPDLGYFPFPSVPGGQGGAGAMMGGADGYSCSKWAPEPACANFLNFLATTPNQEAYYRAFQAIPTNSQAQSLVKDSSLQAAISAQNKAPYSELWFDTLYGENVGTALNTAVVSLLAGKTSVSGMLSAANSAAAKG